MRTLTWKLMLEIGERLRCDEKRKIFETVGGGAN